MVKKLEELSESEIVKGWAEEIMSFIFTRSQENLIKLMPWGDNRQSGGNRKPTKISDKSALLLSGVPPTWEGDTLVIEYSAPHAVDVEYGSEPKDVSVATLAEWARRKLKMKEGASWRFAKNLARRIRREGILPHPYMRPAISEGIMKYNLDIKPPEF